jgi:thioredoxin 2
MGSFYIRQVTDRNFASTVESSDQPVLLFFWAGWCFPCEMLRPIFESLAAEYKNRVLFGVVDTEVDLDTAMKFAVWVLPTVLVLHRGRLIERFQGIRGKLEYRRYLDALLATPAAGRKQNGRYLITSQLN